ncbi:putative secreted protein (Por secretion system target) [Chitinophaga dinghuensis]|uniref:Putative secreted protein (Por secretion system target) n=1 Tax=Chitinophaga dinghuensis TaxID=1539050 RepID=A0A327WDG0_9BACT|nr:T9SS type A sorting domain-containing protein [Chitinophaga dinghuensis]RAJ87446.1 putative secreted protein (Por secretion system target) [Chitinophaga dinghuensis]
MTVLARTGMCLLLLLGVAITSVKAQVVLNRQVVATSGGSGTVGTLRMQYTIGEPVITMITDGHLLLTQGFQQPEELPPPPPGANLVKGYIIFPNPASTNLKIQLDLLGPSYVQIELINTAGQTMYTEQQSLGAGRNTMVIGVNRFAAGIYTLRFKIAQSIYYEKVIIQ